MFSNSVRMHQSPSLFSKFLGGDRPILHPLVKTCKDFLIAVLNIVSYTCSVIMQALASLFSKMSLYFQIVSNTVIMHHLLSLFTKNFFADPNRFKQRRNAPFTEPVFKFSLQFQNLDKFCQEIHLPYRMLAYSLNWLMKSLSWYEMTPGVRSYICYFVSLSLSERWPLDRSVF